MNRKRTVLFVLATVVALILVWLFGSKPSSPPITERIATGQGNEPHSKTGTNATTESIPQQTPESIKARIAQTQTNQIQRALLWRTALQYYGKVVDESNQPISAVQVSFNTSSVNETLTQEEYHKGTVTTDPRGIFKIDGVKGIGMVFELSHPDYYSYPDNSTGFDIRSRPRNGIVPDSEESATLFRMHHKGNPIALIERQGGLHKPADGTMMDFPLRGKTRNEIIGHLEIQGWKGKPDPLKGGHFDWKVKITMPGGGIVESTNYFDFVAPEKGYENTLEITIAKDDPNWQTSQHKKFFFKLPHYFVRGQANIDLYHDLYFSMQYFVNPDGSANLESDPSKPYREP